MRKFLLAMIPLVMSGCSTDINPPPAPTAMTSGAIIGAVGAGAAGSVIGVGAPLAAWFGGLAGAVVGHNLDKQMTLLKEIQDSGVQVLLIGDYVKLVLPADKFFTPGAPTFNTYSFHLLNKIIAFLKVYPTLSVKISAYTDNQGAPERSLALSQQWAEMVAGYLWNHGLDARLLYAQGFGQCDTVASNSTGYGQAANRRIEISLYRVTHKKL